MKHRSYRHGVLARSGVALIGAGLLIATGANARAASAGPFALLPTGAAMSDARLATVRGGFDISPKITVNFAYQQITSVNGTVIAAIAIPQIMISLGRNQAPQIIQTALPAISPAPAASGAPPTTTSSYTVPTTSPSTTPVTGTPGIGQILGLSPSTSRYGNTSVSTQLGAAGFSTVITNMANNVLIQHHINVDIGLTGMPAILASQAHAMVITQAMTDATRRLN